MLNRLMEYAQRHGLAAEPGFARKSVHWALVFDERGTFLQVLEQGDLSAKHNPGRTFEKAPDMPRPVLQGGGKCHFLLESVEVVTLFLGPKSDEKKIKGKHAFFCSTLEEAASAYPALAPIAAFLKDPERLTELHAQLEARKVKPTDSCTLAVGADFPLGSAACLDWWRRYVAQWLGGDDKADAPGAGALDILTGAPCRPLACHPKIKGLSAVGGLAMGDSLISFDKGAFGSYGLDGGGNAAMSDQTAAIYSEALNGLIKDHGRRFCKTLIVHWFKERILPENDPFAFLEEGSDEEVEAQATARHFLDRLQTAEGVSLAGNIYYAMTLSGASGRVMVRDWMEGRFEELARRIDAWFDDLAVVRPDGGGLTRPPKFLAVVASTVRVLDDAPAPLLATLWRTAAQGEPIPLSVMSRALTRVRTAICQDDPLPTNAVGLLKAYHLRQARQKGDALMEASLKPTLNENHPHPAYHCGRLMAVLAALQQAALGDVGAGVVQRYYAAASATPALVLGRLMRTAQFHLGKLDGGLAHWYDGKLAAITGALHDSIPATLSLEEQSLFALGYYQQLADLRTKKSESSATPKEN